MNAPLIPTAVETTDPQICDLCVMRCTAMILTQSIYAGAVTCWQLAPIVLVILFTSGNGDLTSFFLPEIPLPIYKMRLEIFFQTTRLEAAGQPLAIPRFPFVSSPSGWSGRLSTIEKQPCRFGAIHFLSHREMPELGADYSCAA